MAARKNNANLLKESEYLHDAGVATNAVYMAVKEKGFTLCDMTQLCFTLLGDYKVKEKQRVLDIVKACPEQLISNLRLVLSRNSRIAANHPDFKQLDYDSCFTAHDGDPMIEFEDMEPDW